MAVAECCVTLVDRRAGIRHLACSRIAHFFFFALLAAGAVEADSPPALGSG
jgi:hypothetical protein